MKKAITFDGPEFRALSDKAREYGLYIAGGGIVEKGAAFPTGGSIRRSSSGPMGELALRYHKWHIPALDRARHEPARHAGGVQGLSSAPT